MVEGAMMGNKAFGESPRYICAETRNRTHRVPQMSLDSSLSVNQRKTNPEPTNGLLVRSKISYLGYVPYSLELRNETEAYHR
jgi:hypothetical protein